MSTLTLADAKIFLNISASTYDTELQTFIDAAEATIARRVGPLVAEGRTAQVTAVDGVLVLPATPVVSLASVTPVGGSAIDLSGLYLDKAAGVVSGVGAGDFTVAFSAGRAACPPDLLMAVKELVRHLWATQRAAGNGTPAPFSDQTSNTIPGAAFILPFRVTELLAPYMTVTGFA